jgi:anti-sigma regulatory factor (Ser/Thr protein kinase)
LKPIEARKISVLPVTEISQVAEARRAATGLADQLAFDEADIGTIALIVTEAATNLAKHATGGEILLYALQSGEVGGIQVLALDKGPGIASAAQALRDGYSTTGSPGTGLGAMARLATLFDIHSVPGAGTALLASLWSKPSSNTRPPPLEVGALSLPKPGEVVCGDRWAVAWFPDRTLILVADGLGHGPGAAEAAMEAVQTFHERAALTPVAIVESIHAALRSTRGAAVAVTEIAPSSEGSRQMVSHNGTAGHSARRIQEFTYPWSSDALLVLYSDGLVSHLHPERYPGLLKHNPDLIAATLYRDYTRGRDDVTVVVARERQIGEIG